MLVEAWKMWVGICDDVATGRNGMNAERYEEITGEVYDGEAS